MFSCIFINDSRKCKSAQNRDEHRFEKKMTAGLFTKLDNENIFWRWQNRFFPNLYYERITIINKP